MEYLKEVSISNLSLNPFSMVGKEWALLSAGSEESFNMMTVSWGMMGHLWNKDMITVFVRPTRYTLEFLRKMNEFTLSFYPAEHKKNLGVLGSKSGREMDKMKESGLTPISLGKAVTFQEAKLTFVCRKVYCQPLEEKYFLDKQIEKEMYPEKDYHFVIQGEILQVLEPKV